MKSQVIKNVQRIVELYNEQIKTCIELIAYYTVYYNEEKLNKNKEDLDYAITMKVRYEILLEELTR